VRYDAAPLVEAIERLHESRGERGDGRRRGTTFVEARP
jgi:hypothetical protein